MLVLLAAVGDARRAEGGELMDEIWTKGTVRLATRGDYDFNEVVAHEVRGHILGPLAVHRYVTQGRGEGREWTISHVPTGFAVPGGFGKLGDAKKAAETMLEKGGRDWYKGKWGTTHGVKAACRRLAPVVAEVSP